ncbi:hypothetical protein [Tenacibaculum soleae]|uniref:hypothetical protein n=1 Tax=Tenacibaculum soleae TaxID=447689 RepID=UPI0026E47164|nr:hypothetical protein [Tenacibaculum soleae]MDO6811542.1 hypothetical protein [Tenacibaculum soleae]
MTTSSFLLIFIGLFFKYNTSKKIELSNLKKIETWIQNNTKTANTISVLILMATLLLMIRQFGTTSGVLFWLFTITLILSLIIIIAPFKKINYKHITFLFAISFLIEILL